MTKILVFIPRWWTVCVRNFATSVQRPFTRNENFFYFIYFFFFFDQSSNEFESTITRLIVAQSFETCCLCVIRGCRCTAGESSRLLQVSSLHAHFLVQTPYDAPLPLQPERDTFPVYVMCDYRSKYSSNVYKHVRRIHKELPLFKPHRFIARALKEERKRGGIGERRWIR